MPFQIPRAYLEALGLDKPPDGPGMSESELATPNAPAPEAAYMAELKEAQAQDAAKSKKNRIADAILSIGLRKDVRRAPVTSGVEAFQQQHGLQRELEASALARAKREKDAQLEKEMNDPKSERSLRAREALKGFDMGRKVLEHLGPGADNLPASQIPGMRELLMAEMKRNEEDPSKARYRDAQVEELKRKAAEAESKKQENLRFLDVVRTRYPELRKQLDGVESLSPDAISKLVDSAERTTGFNREMFKQEDAQKFSSGENQLNRQAAVDKENREEGRKFEEREVPGFVQQPGARASEPEVRSFRDAKAQTDVLRSTIGKLGAALKNGGIEVMPGERKANLESLVTDLQLQAKGEALYKLGVLAGPDMDLLTKVTGDPTSWKSYFGSTAALERRLANMLESAERRLQARAESLRYAPKGREVATGMVRMTNGSEVLDVPEADVAAAEKDGFRRE